MSFQRILLLFLFALIVGLPSYSQKSKQYAPRGAVWGYTYYDGFCWPVGCHGGWVDEVIGDTVIRGHLFAVITRSNYYNTRHVNDEIIYRGIVNDSLIEIKNNVEQFLLDFSWNSGDTIASINVSPNMNIDTLVHTFKIKDTIISNSDTMHLIKPILLRINSSGFMSNQESSILGGIGSQSHLFYQPPQHIIHSKGAPYLICYEESNGFTLPPSKYSSCKKAVENYIALGIKNIDVSNSYYVKTINSKLILSNKENTDVEGGDLIIRNVQRQIVLSKEMYTLGSEIDISGLTNGIYFLEFNLSKNQKVSLKFIVSE